MYAAELIRLLYSRWLTAFPTVPLSSTFSYTQAFPFARIKIARNGCRHSNGNNFISKYNIAIQIYHNNLPDLSDLSIQVGALFNKVLGQPAPVGSTGRLIHILPTVGDLSTDSADYKGQDVCQATLGWEATVQELIVVSTL